MKISTLTKKRKDRLASVTSSTLGFMNDTIGVMFDKSRLGWDLSQYSIEDIFSKFENGTFAFNHIQETVVLERNSLTYDNFPVSINQTTTMSGHRYFVVRFGHYPITQHGYKEYISVYGIHPSTVIVVTRPLQGSFNLNMSLTWGDNRITGPSSINGSCKYRKTGDPRYEAIATNKVYHIGNEITSRENFVQWYEMIHMQEYKGI